MFSLSLYSHFTQSQAQAHVSQVFSLSFLLNANLKAWIENFGLSLNLENLCNAVVLCRFSCALLLSPHLFVL